MMKQVEKTMLAVLTLPTSPKKKRLFFNLVTGLFTRFHSDAPQRHCTVEMSYRRIHGLYPQAIPCLGLLLYLPHLLWKQRNWCDIWKYRVRLQVVENMLPWLRATCVSLRFLAMMELFGQYDGKYISKHASTTRKWLVDNQYVQSSFFGWCSSRRRPYSFTHGCARTHEVRVEWLWPYLCTLVMQGTCSMFWGCSLSFLHKLSVLFVQVQFWLQASFRSDARLYHI